MIWRVIKPTLGIIRLILVTMVVFIFLTVTVSAQNENNAKTGDLDLNRSLLSNMVNKPVQATPLDQPVDPNTYRVGPGDELTIFIWGNIQAQYTLTITPEGKLLVPTVGPLDLSGMNLAEAKRFIEQQVMERYRNVKITTDLTNLRIFRVYVGGAVNMPGVYMANGATRVSEVIGMAGGFVLEDLKGEQWEREGNDVNKPLGIASHRNIILKHINGVADTADVLRFELAADFRYDYRLSDGDQIFVPAREKDINLYGIFGGVRNPGYYEYSYRDSLKDLILLGHGLTLNADSSEAELVRFDQDNKSSQTIRLPLKEILHGSKPDIHLLPDDRVYIKVRNNFNEKQQVLVLGEVNYPGFYAIKPESTFITDIIKQAGGFTPLASLPEAEMTRFASDEIKDREFERLKTMQVQDMSDIEYEYFKMKSRQKPGRVSVDFVDLFLGKKTGDIKLHDGDIIMIPRISEVVNVSGEVANPGLLSYKPEYTYIDYIKKAGGFSFRADKSQVRLIKGVTGEWRKPNKKTKLAPGDTILIPEKKRINYLATIKDVMVFAGSMATVYLVIKQASE
jgi:protein involved in polysaccharide export with SLBB domain